MLSLAQLSPACFYFLDLCEENKYRDVDCQVGNGLNYRGAVNVTRSGKACQNWNSQSPHEHGWGSVGDHNNCRNPDHEPHVWCYTTASNKRWEFCDVRTCTGCDKEKPKEDPDVQTLSED